MVKIVLPGVFPDSGIGRFVAVIVLSFAFLQSGTFSQTASEVYSAEWTAAQKDVWATVNAYSEASHQRDLDKYLSFWHPEFFGWHNGDSRPTNYQQRSAGLRHYFDGTRSLDYTLEPMRIQILADGKAAIAHYKLRNTLLVVASGKKERGTSYWTDYLVSENGRWLLISDHGGSVPEEENALNQLGWLLGKWKRIDVRPGQTAFETWRKDSPGKFSGTGVTLQGKDTVFIETLSLTVKDGSLYYIAQVSHNPDPTFFKITQFRGTGFVCENPRHDYPKKIDYALDGERLTVVISDDGKSDRFLFEKLTKTDDR